MKMDNLGRFDDTLARKGISGLKNGSKREKEIWDEFIGRRDALSETYCRLRSRLMGHETVADDVTLKTPQGLDGVRLSKYRINQSFRGRAAGSGSSPTRGKEKSLPMSPRRTGFMVKYPINQQRSYAMAANLEMMTNLPCGGRGGGVGLVRG